MESWIINKNYNHVEPDLFPKQNNNARPLQTHEIQMPKFLLHKLCGILVTNGKGVGTGENRKASVSYYTRQSRKLILSLTLSNLDYSSFAGQHNRIEVI